MMALESKVEKADSNLGKNKKKSKMKWMLITFKSKKKITRDFKT